MSRRRKPLRLSPETRIAAVIFGGFIAYCFWFVWIGGLSPAYRACLLAYSGIRARGSICSVQLLEGGPFDYLVFAAQWLPFAIVVGWLWTALRPLRKRLRARRANHKPASSNKILSE